MRSHGSRVACGLAPSSSPGAACASRFADQSRRYSVSTEEISAQPLYRHTHVYIVMSTAEIIGVVILSVEVLGRLEAAIALLLGDCSRIDPLLESRPPLDL